MTRLPFLSGVEIIKILSKFGYSKVRQSGYFIRGICQSLEEVIFLRNWEKMIKIIVTGGAGFIGSHLVDRLINEGYKVIVIDNLSTGKKENLNPKAKFYKIDIRSPKIFEIFKKEKPEIVFHLAAQIDVRKSVEDPFESAKINILGSLNLIENFVKLYFAKKSHGFTTDKNVRISSREGSHEFAKFIFASTGGAIYGDAKIIPTPENYPEFPVSPYGIEKLIVEKLL